MFLVFLSPSCHTWSISFKCSLVRPEWARIAAATSGMDWETALINGVSPRWWTMSKTRQSTKRDESKVRGKNERNSQEQHYEKEPKNKKKNSKKEKREWKKKSQRKQEKRERNTKREKQKENDNKWERDTASKQKKEKPDSPDSNVCLRPAGAQE